MNLQQQFIDFIKQHCLFDQKARLLVAASGGVDSMVLCELLARSGFDFAMAHCNFQLRGAESEADEIFVKKMATGYQVDFFCKRFDTKEYASNKNVNIQIAARELRYDWFNEIISNESRPPFKCIVTGHHANDNVETVMMNFFKGTGINGLQGMLPTESGLGGRVVRPLLFATKEMILDFANSHGLLWREDASNDTNQYTRNYCRNEILPALQKVYPQVEKNLLSNIDRFREIHEIYQEAIHKKITQIFLPHKNEIHIPVLKLIKTKGYPAVLFEGLKSYGFSSGQIPEVIKLLKADSGSYLASSTHRLIKHRSFLILTPHQSEQSEMILLEEGVNKLKAKDFTIQLYYTDDIKLIDEDNKVVALDANLLTFPLVIRKWKQGDYFYPLGMNKKKKLSRFFIDQKLSLTQKEQVWVVESNKRIVWIMGYRIDNRFKITPKTTKMVKLILVDAK